MAVPVEIMRAVAARTGARAERLERMRIGSAVFCRDGRAGRVARIVVAPSRRLVTHLVVATGFAVQKHLVVPVERVLGASDARVDLNMTVAELKRQPRFREVDYVARDPSWAVCGSEHDARPLLVTPDGVFLPSAEDRVPRGWMIQHQHVGLPAEATPVGRSTPVGYADQRIGWIDEVVLDGRRPPRIKQVVVRLRGFFGRELVVPIERVRSVDEGGVWLDCDPRQPAGLPRGRGETAARGPSEPRATCVG